MTVLFASNQTLAVLSALVYYLGKFKPEMDYCIKQKYFALNCFVHRRTETFLQSRDTHLVKYIFCLLLFCAFLQTHQEYTNYLIAVL